MNHIINRKSSRAVALLLAFIIAFSLFPIPASANQDNGYHDPAKQWITSGSRLDQYDANCIVTHGSSYCAICGKVTGYTSFRVPEYSIDGKSALTRNVKYSDGTCYDGKNTGVILDGTPGVNAYYTGCHWCKVICDVCGSPNTNNLGINEYAFNKNIYWLYTCDDGFMVDLDETVSYECADSTYHRKTTTGGSYCGFCYGTNYENSTVLERHTMERTVIPQLGNQRFLVKDTCSQCGYERQSYIAAKSVVADYYGLVDGQPHTLTVTDLSDPGVTVQIRYGNSAESCNLTTAPNYTDEGQYRVYYETTYTFGGESMTENGVAYVWLRDENPGTGNGSCGGSGGDAGSGNHNYAFLERINATCLTLGYDRYLCTNCGNIEQRNYTNALGHNYQGVLIREATCEVDGKLLEICQRCGDVKVTNTPKGEHQYESHTVAATCTSPGYTVKECTVCGDRHITNITDALPHNYETVVTPASCEAGGHTTHICFGCGSSFVTDPTEAHGHQWDNGTIVTDKTCDGSGVTEYRCVRCGYHRLEGIEATGHIPGAEATCTTPQVCTKCGVVLAVAKGHKASDWIVDKEPTTSTEGSQHKECVNCGETLETEVLDKLYRLATTDTHGEAVVGGYLVIVTDKDTENPVFGATVRLNEDGTISVLLPNNRLLDYAEQTTVTVLLNRDRTPVSNMGMEITDKNANACTGQTNKAGQLTVPGTAGSTNSGGKVTAGWEDPDGNRKTLTVKVEHTDTGRPIEGAQVSIGKTGNVTVTLPDGVDLDKDHRITVTVTDNEKAPQNDVTVIVKNDLGHTEQGKTDANGKLTVPANSGSTGGGSTGGSIGGGGTYYPSTAGKKHSAYIAGYPDGIFGPERSMTRAEATAIFARLLAEKRNNTIEPVGFTGFLDVPSHAWYSGYVRYLVDAGVVSGTTATTFEPGREITRAEFVAMAVRFVDAYGITVKPVKNSGGFKDVSDGDWAAEYIRNAAKYGWVSGYGDGTFRGDTTITRAEVVSIVNRLLERTADTKYIANNLSKLNTFTDLSKAHWAYYPVMEAANTHTGRVNTNGETWSK